MFNKVCITRVTESAVIDETAAKIGLVTMSGRKAVCQQNGAREQKSVSAPSLIHIASGDLHSNQPVLIVQVK
jgi:hypothetical protein